MAIKCIIHEFLNKNPDPDNGTIGLLEHILEFCAYRSDSRITSDLLKKLIFSYAEQEKNLYELNQQKNKFLGILAHDLRNQITSITGLTEILMGELKDNLTPDQEEIFKIIIETSQNTYQHLNDLLVVSAIENEKLELNLEKDNLAKIIEQAVKVNKIRGNKKNVSIDADFENIPEIYFDRNKLFQVFERFISNAIKFSPYNSKVLLKMNCIDDFITIKIKDFGPGIPIEEQRKLFDFYQKSNLKTPGRERVSGLGMAISKRIVEAHKGSLEMFSLPGEGTEFTFNFAI
jgi:two-component system sensor histidine kinase/response regulator